MTTPNGPLRVLVLCTGNSARSILGEAIPGAMGAGRVVASSAGSRPRAEPNPAALRLLAAKGIDPAPFRSKSCDEFTGEGAPPIDIAITVCGNAAQETCPFFSGAPVKAHWGLPDPAEEPEDTIDAAFADTWDALCVRVAAMLALPLEAMDRAELANELARIGHMEGAV